jgi:tRNA 2-thiocytidine biosynthesis protein TtcA
MAPPVSKLERTLLRRLKQTCEKYALIAPGDKIGIGLSGGKDSYALFTLMHRLVRALPFRVELLGLHLDQRQPGYDGAPLQRWLVDFGEDFEILAEDTYSVVTSQLQAGATYCSLCSRLRRGVLYTALARRGFNKLALGHHRDDALETFLMNLIYSGKLQAMPAIYTTDDGALQVIRPLVECAERWLVEFAEQMEFPILPCNLCGSQEGLKRERVAALLEQLEAEKPDVRSVMANALGNVRPTHLLDLDVGRAWRERSRDIRPDPPARATPKHMDASPERAVSKRLPMI